MSSWFRDLRFALRMLRKNPEVTAVAVVAMGLALGATSTVFSAIDALVLNPFGFPDDDRLMALYEIDPAAPEIWRTASDGNFVDWREGSSQTFDSLVAGRNISRTLTDLEVPETPLMREVTAGYFELLGTRPLLGRTFLPEDDMPGAPKVVILHHQLWQQEFSADPNIVGKTTGLDGEPAEIVGVMPPGFDNPAFSTVVPPMAWVPLALPATGLERGRGNLLVLGRLAEDMTREQAQQAFDSLSATLAERHPQTNTDTVARVVPLPERTVRNIRPSLMLLFGAVLLVLLVACSNVANLLLARSVVRRQEIALRRALGAGGGQLIRQLLVESLLLSLLGGALGLLLAVWGTQALQLMVPRGFNIPPALFDVDHRVLLFTFALSLVTGLIFGLLPALQTLGRDLDQDLGGGASRTTGDHARRRLRGALVMAEVAFSLMLLIGAGLMVRSFSGLMRLDPGFDATNVLTFRVSTRGPDYEEPAAREAFFRQLVEEFQDLPGVSDAGAITALPFFTSLLEVPIQLPAAPPPEPGQGPRVIQRMMIPGFLEALHIPLVRGRSLDLQDDAESPPVLLISETMAETLWPEGDALGQFLMFPADGVERQVVGIVGDIRSDAQPPDPQPIAYLPLAQAPGPTSIGFVVRTEGEPMAYLEAVRRAVNRVDARMPVYVARPLETQLQDLDWASRFLLSLLAIFAVLGLALAATGIYAVLSYVVSRRTREIGIRMALGARRSHVLTLVLRRGLALTAGGIAFGLLGAILLSRALSSQLYGVAATDPTTYAVLALGLVLVAVIASALPALRATRLSPTTTLRQE